MKRRDFNTLLGLGALLHPLASESLSKVSLKKNVVLISTNYGFLKDRFQPSSEALNSSYLNFYEKTKNKVTIFKGIQQKEMGGGHRSHHSIFTAQSKYNKITPPFVSLDQLIASRVTQTTRHKFLALSTGKSSQTCWSLSGQNIPPLQTYEESRYKIFKEKIDTENLLELKTFLNHFQTSSFSKSNSEYYQKAVLDMGKEMDSHIYWSKKDLPNLNPEFEYSKNEFMNLEGYLDLIFLALQHQQCRIFNFNIGHGGTVDLEGVREGYHKLTHHANVPEMRNQLIQIEEFQLHHLSRFLEKLDRHQLLDETVVLITGAFGDSSSHSTNDLPLMVAGGGLEHKGLIECKSKTGEQLYRLSDLYVRLLKNIGLSSIDSFAGYHGKMNASII